MFMLTHRDTVFDPLCHWACPADLLWKFQQQFSPERAAMHYSNVKKETRLNLKHPAELMKDAAGIFLIWEFKNVWLHCQRSPARAFYVKLQTFHQPGWQSRATLEETTTKKKRTRANQMRHRWFDLCLYQRETWYTYQCCCHFVSCLKCNS